MTLATPLLALGLVCLVSSVLAVAPVCSPTTISVILGINTTANSTLASLSCTDATAGHTITYEVSNTTDGYTYFSMNNNDLLLANRLDVEYGAVIWSVLVLAIDNAASPNTGTVTISFTTYQSTTTTTTTPAPPGYSWFDKEENVMLLGATAGVAALTIATCILLCWRFHRVGTCLPKYCPEYRDCRASFNRNVTCCPIPCDFRKKTDIDDDKVASLPEHEQSGPFGADPFLQNTNLSDKKSSRGLKSKSPKTYPPLPKPQMIKEEDEESLPDRKLIVSPVVVGNVNLQDVGFDGMRSPGFNAPMFTTYGGKNDHKPPKIKKY